MNPATRRCLRGISARLVRLLAASVFACACPAALAQPAPGGPRDSSIVRYGRFEVDGVARYGILEGDHIRELEGDLFGTWKKTDRRHALSSVKLLVPVDRPRQVFAMAGNYKSHLGGGNLVTTVTTTTKITITPTSKHPISESRTTVETEIPGEVPTRFQTPQAFLKPPACLAPHGASIVLPRGSNDVHYEAELVVVIGTMARNVSREQAAACVFGVTAGNDVSARDWQKADVQWWRAKGCDTFGPCGPWIVTGLNYDDLRVQLRLNGKVVQDERTTMLIHGVRDTISFLSQHTTLYPGDLVYMGTSGKTGPMKAGDIVEVEVEGVGVLKNPVVAE